MISDLHIEQCLTPLQDADSTAKLQQGVAQLKREKQSELSGGQLSLSSQVQNRMGMRVSLQELRAMALKRANLTEEDVAQRIESRGAARKVRVCAYFSFT